MVVVSVAVSGILHQPHKYKCSVVLAACMCRACDDLEPNTARGLFNLRERLADRYQALPSEAFLEELLATPARLNLAG